MVEIKQKMKLTVLAVNKSTRVLSMICLPVGSL